jgi:soluble lytic murein transglycosylase-like protein
VSSRPHSSLLLALLLSAISPPSLAFDLRPVASNQWTKKYDDHFRKNAKHYFGPAIDWHWFKAQGIAESDLRPNAISPKNAQGIMQILPSTFDEIRSKAPELNRALLKDPRWNIAAGIYYDRYLYNSFGHIETTQDRLNYMFGSYNSGKARLTRLVQGRYNTGTKWPNWSEAEEAVPNETAQYVKRIQRLMIIE